MEKVEDVRKKTQKSENRTNNKYTLEKHINRSVDVNIQLKFEDGRIIGLPQSIKDSPQNISIDLNTNLWNSFP